MVFPLARFTSPLSLGLLLATTAQAQLLATPAQTLSQPVLQGFKPGQAGELTRGQATLKLDVAGGRVAGLYVTAPLNDTEAVARVIAAAWGASSPAAIKSVQDILKDPQFQRQAKARLFQELDAEGGQSFVALRIRGDHWQGYTALKVYPTTAFPAARSPLGVASAPVRIDIASDYQCPACESLWSSEMFREWRAQKNTYRIYYHHFPLSMHKSAMPAAEASECAADQGLFWPMTDKLFGRFREWARLDPAAAQNRFTAYAAAAGLNANTFSACLRSGRHRQAISQSMRQMAALNVRGTPTVYLGGIKLNNYTDPREVAALRQLTSAAPSARQLIEQRLSSLR